MSSTSIKRQNHRIHPCSHTRKNELIRFLIERNTGKNILIVTSDDAGEIKNLFAGNNINVLSDAELAKKSDLHCNVLISYDLPEKAILYMARFARADEYALIMLDAEDQKKLYPIELLNGRTIVQEVIQGFEPDFGIAVEKEQQAQVKAEKEARKEYFAAQDAKKTEGRQRRDSRPAYKTENADKPQDKNKKPHYLGKDENGKAIFEGKTRERNHYFDGTPRTEDEKRSRTKYGSKPVFFGDKAKKGDDSKRSEGDKKPYGEKKSYGNKPAFGEKKPFGDKKPYGDKKEFTEKKSFGDKKPYGEKNPHGDKPAFGNKKSFGEKKPYGDKKPYGEKKSSNDRKPADTPAAPKRPPRRIDVKSFKSPKESE